MNTERIEGDRTEAVVPRIIAEQLGRGITLADCKPEAKLADLGADDLDRIEIVMTLEDEFGIEIPDAECNKLLTVGDHIAIVDRKLAALPALPKLAHGVPA